ncbi:ABC transporter ATP-binding protein [Nemorincola caseinilytica]|uniref:ABC transporter ATP-binding protein n=1 Tax=Nemorincola caseinilytica TaxID=2054315 RepID=A0ABP8NA80_9BACT
MSSNIVIKAENISKQYQIGQIGTGMISHDIKRWWALMRGKEDPYLKVGMENDRTQKATSAYTWAVKDINFDVQQGEALGVIGKNGAGKSTLLKLLSRVTAPTTGQIKIKGRVASLLEVGTGFHPELTGRENIYMNGTILGMTRKEIARKFDEIVDFSGVQMYIDTPVKRYSSGMYVRLAFGVAAHLEPEILIVDEVLAVGDAEFQKKCIGKMSDVASHGRTIIFVSHNLLAVQSLCKSAIFMKAGTIADSGPTEKVINNYLSREIRNCIEAKWDMDKAPGNDRIRLLSARINVEKQIDGQDVIDVNTPFDIDFEFYNGVDGQGVNLSLVLYTTSGVCVFNVTTPVAKLSKGHHTSRLRIPGSLLNDDIYTIVLFLVKDGSSVLHVVEDVLTFEVLDVKRGDTGWFGKWVGAVRPTMLEFTID